MSDVKTAAPSTDGATDTGDNTSAPAVGGIGTPAPKAPAPPPKSLKIKGVEFVSEDAAFAEIERGRKSNQLLTEAHKRLSEAQKRDKEWESLRSEVKTKKDARKVIENLGLSKDEAIEIFGRYIYDEEVLPREMSPEQRRIRELESEKARFEEERAREKQQREEAQLAERTKKAEANLRAELTKVLEGKKVPATRLALRRLANYLASYANAGAEIPVERAADLVMDDYKNEFTELLGEATPEQMIDFLGKDAFLAFAKKISDWAVRSSAQRQPNFHETSRKSVSAVKSGSQNAKMTPQEFEKYMRSVK